MYQQDFVRDYPKCISRRLRFLFQSERDYQMCISRKFKFLSESGRDYPTNISRNPSEIIIGVHIHYVLRVVYLRYYEAIFHPSHALLYVFKRAFTTSAAHYFSTSSKAFSLRLHTHFSSHIARVILRTHARFSSPSARDFS